MKGIKTIVIFAVLALLVFNWPVVEYFQGDVCRYLFMAWFAVVLANVALSCINRPDVRDEVE